MAPDDAQGAGEEPQEQAITPPTAEPAGHQTAEGATLEAGTDWSPDSLPETDRDKFSKWADKAKAEYHRQEITRAGNWIANLPPEDRERIKKDPYALRRLESQLEEARRAAVGQAGVQAPKAPTSTESADDGLEKEADDLLREQGFYPDQEGYDRLVKLEVSRLRRIEKRMLKAIEGRVDSVAERASAKLTKDELNRQFIEVGNSEEWNDPQKGDDFQIIFRGLVSSAHAKGIPVNPQKLALEAKRRVFPVAAAPAAKPKASFGDKSNGKVGASVNADPLEDWINQHRAKGVDVDNANFR